MSYIQAPKGSFDELASRPPIQKELSEAETNVANEAEYYTRQVALGQAVKVNLNAGTTAYCGSIVKDAQVFYDFLKGNK